MDDERFRMWIATRRRSGPHTWAPPDDEAAEFDRAVPVPNIGDWCEDMRTGKPHVVNQRAFAYTDSCVIVTLFLDGPADGQS